MSDCFCYSQFQQLPRDIHTHSQAGIGGHRNELLGCLAEDVVHADEEVEALGMDVDKPTHAGSKAVDAEVNTTINPLEGFPVGAQACIGPRIRTTETTAAEETEGNLAIDRQVILYTKVHGTANACGASTLVRYFRQVDEVGQLVLLAISLVRKRFGTVLRDLCIMEAVELEGLS